ncbi:lipoprotein-releasing ABC transporter permease subunit [Shewanella gelidimarina]|uniref:lipoprotein-releasing ABC transporter permease subunit n=1 Tax=Shewanella gelidimarina TaxID=56813 RepID=UPI00200C4877|nr:lipoprotein-releasing ABC transporter permease subunit [Shewanella gelidimarina]MCL1059119.1 lipoprotein-releasing ABC transporter permease subunit [Shewanella gelidimarina]
MNFSLSFYIGYRYWRARKANAFASFITIFSVSGILLGVAALIVVSSVMNGLEGQLKKRILGAVPQLTIHSPVPLEHWQQDVTKLSALKGVQGAAPSVSTQAMLQSPSNIGAAQIYGVYPEQEKNLLSLTRNTYAGNFDALIPGKYQIILGAELARKLDVVVGNKIRVLSGDGVVYTPLGPVPSQRKFTVAGVFEMGSQVDASVAYIHHDDAQRLMRQKAGEVKQLRVYLDDPFNAAKIAPSVVDYFSHTVTTTDWHDTYGHLFGAVKMEKNMMSLMLSLIIAVAAFNIVSALVMMVVDKTTDVAVLKTQGLSTANVMGIFMIQGSLNAIIGLVTGVATGALLTINLNEITNALGISILGAGQNLPVQLDFNQLSSIVIGTLVITLLATIYPALRAANVQPASALRHE